MVLFLPILGGDVHDDLSEDDEMVYSNQYTALNEVCVNKRGETIGR